MYADILISHVCNVWFQKLELAIFAVRLNFILDSCGARYIGTECGVKLQPAGTILSFINGCKKRINNTKYEEMIK